MEATIDKAGRVVIPVAIRTAAGWRPGTKLEVILDDGVVRLVKSVPGPRLERTGHRLVARPSVAASERAAIDVEKWIDEERDRWPS